MSKPRVFRKAITMSFFNTKDFYGCNWKTFAQLLLQAVTLCVVLLLCVGRPEMTKQLGITIAIITFPFILVFLWHLFSNIFRRAKAQVIPVMNDTKQLASLIVMNTGKQKAKFSARMLNFTEITEDNNVHEIIGTCPYPFYTRWCDMPIPSQEIEIKPRCSGELPLAELSGFAIYAGIEQERVELKTYPVQKDANQIKQGIGLSSQLICEVEVMINPSITEPQVYKYRLLVERVFQEDGIQNSPKWKEFVEVKP